MDNRFEIANIEEDALQNYPNRMEGQADAIRFTLPGIHLKFKDLAIEIQNRGEQT